MRARQRAAAAAVAAALLLLVGCTAAPTGPATSGPSRGAGATTEASPSASGEPDGSEEPEITVRAAGSAWLVRGTGFAGGNQYLVQCVGGTTTGASALDECDMSTSEQVVADESGRISATRQARAFVNVGSVSEVDCTDDPCALAVADLSDKVLAAADAPLPGGAEPPDAPTLELSEQRFGVGSREARTQPATRHRHRPRPAPTPRPGRPRTSGRRRSTRSRPRTRPARHSPRLPRRPA